MGSQTEGMETCPACGRAGALLPLGARYDRPHRWRPWISARIDLYLCDHCDAIMAVPAVPDTAMSVSLPARTTCGITKYRLPSPTGVVA